MRCQVPDQDISFSRAPCQQGTTADPGFPTNAVSKKAYRGVNVLPLMAQGFQSKFWATYRQWQAIGGQVRRGERGTKIVFYKPVAKTVITDAGEEETEEFFVLRAYTVFKRAQCNGPAIDLPTPTQSFVDFQPAEEAIAATQATIRFSGERAAYFSEADYIQLPPKTSFKSERDYYGTAFHELIHYTGHESRLNRLQKNPRFGDAAYASEELVAEIGGCFVCTELNLPQSDDLSNQHAYLGYWLKLLQADHGAILRAASQASKAADFNLALRDGADRELS